MTQMVSGIFNAAGTLSKGEQNANQYEAYSQANRYNAAVIRQRAELTSSSFNAREEQQRYLSRIAKGEAMAGAAQSKTGFGGSNADVEHQNEVLAELDALNVRYEGQLQVRDLKSEADLQDWESNLNQMNKSFARKQAAIGAVGAAFGGMSSYSDSQRTSLPKMSNRNTGTDYPKMNYNSYNSSGRFA